MITTIMAGFAFGSCIALICVCGNLSARISDLEKSHSDLALDFMHHDVTQLEFARLKGWVPSPSNEEVPE